MAIAQGLCGVAYAVDAAPIESDRRILKDALGASGQAAAVDLVYRRQQALLHLLRGCLLWMTEFDAEKDPARHHVA